MQATTLLENLSNAFGVAGFEDEVRDVITGYVKPFVDSLRTDALGNLIAFKKGKTETRLMFDAHMDEIGLMISFIEDNGYLRFTNIGGWDPRVLPSHMVTIRTRDGQELRGVMGTAPPHVQRPRDREKPIPMEDLFIDVGATSADEAKEMGVRIGDAATVDYPFEVFNDNYVLGKAFDDRAGCAVIIEVLEMLSKETLDVTLVCNFAVCEERGLLGAKTAAFDINPTIALAFEGTTACDMPGIAPNRQVAQQGKGPAITVADNSLIVNRKLVSLLERLAEENGIPWQYKMPSFGGTDAGAIQSSRAGVLVGVLSVPCRYIHSAHSTLRIDDLEHTVKLAAEFARHSTELL